MSAEYIPTFCTILVLYITFAFCLLSLPTLTLFPIPNLYALHTQQEHQEHPAALVGHLGC